jgi:hypothetical protein
LHKDSKYNSYKEDYAAKSTSMEVGNSCRHASPAYFHHQQNQNQSLSEEICEVLDSI